ncbi:MAG: TlpA family protein disulfide reductase, partial [Planctomycetaceae bacterium]|nr:TlpA family protein disulfide reductase [Planctomycetaceae bacterium]
SLPLDLQPGEHKNIELGNTGTTVTGSVVATGRGDVSLNKNWSLNYLIRRDGGISLPEDFPKLSFDPSGPVQTSWARDPHYASWLRSRHYYFLKLTPEGRFQISGVPPGKYDLILRLFEEPAGCLVDAVGTKVIPVTVTVADIKAKNKDLGSIDVACRVGPRVGESMYAYKFTDTTGVEHSIYEMKGRYILMHVWASWCAPCLKNMPDIQVTADQLSEKPLTFVGLNVDQYPEDAKRLVEKNKWNWAQNYLGDHSDMARQLAISSIPVYYLIGPDGKLAATANEWTDMKATLKKTFKQKE